MRAVAKGQRFMHITAETGGRNGNRPPVFSEDFLYPKLGKEDARFVLGVAEEYEKVIQTLGPTEVAALIESPEQKERVEQIWTRNIMASRRAMSEAAARLCKDCRSGLRLDPNRMYSGSRDVVHI